jgi:Domain of unknown function (DUF5348)
MTKEWERAKPAVDAWQEAHPFMTEGILVASSNRGRYALNDAEEGCDLTSGDVCEVWLGGQWARGSIEHTHSLYADEVTNRIERGYYFRAEGGGICGLCVGMKVRLP